MTKQTQFNKIGTFLLAFYKTVGVRALAACLHSVLREAERDPIKHSHLPREETCIARLRSSVLDFILWSINQDNVLTLEEKRDLLEHYGRVQSEL